MPEGSVEVELIQGIDLKDVEIFGKSDPYAVIKIGDLKQTSKTIHHGGKNPVWNQSFLVQIPDGPHELQVAVYDAAKHGADKVMGTLSVPLSKVFAERQIAPAKYKVHRADGKFQGELELGLKFFPKVHHGVLELSLVEAHDLLAADTFGKSDPYAMIYCHKEARKSRVIKDSIDPVWNESFTFNVNNVVMEIIIKLFDKDDLDADDPLGTAVVPLSKVFSEGSIPATRYKVLGDKGQPQGEISVALKFHPQN